MSQRYQSYALFDYLFKGSGDGYLNLIKVTRRHQQRCIAKAVWFFICQVLFVKAVGQKNPVVA